MTFFNRKLFRSCFTILCGIAVIFMVGYWFYKYKVEDRDIGVVDYVSLADAKEFQFPVVSLCFKDPVIDERLRKINSSITRWAYQKYLRGELYDQTLENIDYANVPWNKIMSSNPKLLMWPLTWNNVSSLPIYCGKMKLFKLRFLTLSITRKYLTDIIFHILSNVS